MAEDRQLLAWQRRMAAFMTASVIVAAAFFAIVTLWQYGRFEAILVKPAAALEDVWSRQVIAPTTYEQQFELAKTRAAFALERELIARRYDQANLTLTTRLWTRLMGFITGMILALVGAAFVLGKLSEAVSEAAAKAGLPGQEWSFSVRSASPGVILAVLGTLLMALSITIQASYSTEDRAIYFGRAASTPVVPGPGEAVGPASPTGLSNMLKPPKQPTPGR
jgi:hypothetical protein